MRLVSLLAIAAAAVVATPASAVTYVTGTATFNALGDTIGSQFDQVTLNSVTGTVSGPGTYLLNTVDFTVGINSNTGGLFTGTFANTIQIGATTYSYTLPYALTISLADTLVFTPTTFTQGGFRFTTNPLVFADIGLGTVSGDLSVNVTAVPEPAAWGLMILGFGAVGGAMRRRATVRQSVAFAH